METLRERIKNHKPIEIDDTYAEWGNSGDVLSHGIDVGQSEILELLDGCIIVDATALGKRVVGIEYNLKYHSYALSTTMSNTLDWMKELLLDAWDTPKQTIHQVLWAEVVKLFVKMKADQHVLAPISSRFDTMTDLEVLECLQDLNKFWHERSNP